MRGNVWGGGGEGRAEMPGFTPWPSWGSLISSMFSPASLGLPLVFDLP